MTPQASTVTPSPFAEPSRRPWGKTCPKTRPQLNDDEVATVLGGYGGNETLAAQSQRDRFREPRSHHVQTPDRMDQVF